MPTTDSTAPAVTPGQQWSARRRGLASAALVVLLSLLACSAVSPATFSGIFSFVALCCIPIQILLAHHWPGRRLASGRAASGLAWFALMLVTGAVAAFIVQFVIARGWGIAFPGLPMFCIVAVVVTLWLVLVCDGWPFTLLRSRILRVAVMTAAVYLLAYLLFRLLFDFSAFGLPSGAGLRPAPTGLFDAFHALTFLVTVISGLFLAPCFRFAGMPSATGPRALANTALCLIWGTLLYGVGVGLLGMDVVRFLIWVPVPVLFGGLIVVKMCQGQFFAHPRQTLPNGALTLATLIVVGEILVALYGELAILVHPGLVWGAPTYAGELLVANATLALTFLLLNVAADFFDYWPLPAAATQN